MPAGYAVNPGTTADHRPARVEFVTRAGVPSCPEKTSS